MVGNGGSEFDGFRFIKTAGSNTYRPRRYMHPEKASFFNKDPTPPHTSGIHFHPKPQLADIPPARFNTRAQTARLHTERPQPSANVRPSTVPLAEKPNKYAKIQVHSMYSTTGRLDPPPRFAYDKDRYFGRAGSFTKEFVGGMYANVSLSTSLPECKVLHHENFGYP